MIGPNESNLDKSKYIIVMVQTIQELITSKSSFIDVGFKNCFGVCLFSRTTFVFFVSFNSDIFWGWGKGPNTVLGSTDVVEQLYFSMLP